MNSNFDIGNRLRQLRTEKALSQEQLANFAEVTSTYFGQVERNMKNVTVAKLESICDVLNITLAEFFSDCEPEKVKETDDLTTETIHQLIDRLSPAEKQSMLNILRELVAFRKLDKE